MKEALNLEAKPRERAGKGSARAARREGFVPAVIYGDKKPPVMINIPRNVLTKVLNKGGFLTNLFEIKINGKTEKVLPRDIQTDPVSDSPMHVDFLRLSAGTKIFIEVPVHFKDHEESEGLSRGGVLNVVRHQIECHCLMEAIPEYFEASLKGLDIGDAVHISDIKLPEGVELAIKDRDFTIATIAPPSILTAEEEAGEAPEEEGEEGEELEEGEEAEGGEEGEAAEEGAEKGEEEGKPEGKEEGKGE